MDNTSPLPATKGHLGIYFIANQMIFSISEKIIKFHPSTFIFITRFTDAKLSKRAKHESHVF